MDDNEINKRVAEIEGINPWLDCPFEENAYSGWIVDKNDKPVVWYNGQIPPYATDWAWTGPLMEKYHLTAGPVSPRQEAYPDAKVSKLWWCDVSDRFGVPVEQDIPPRLPAYADTPQRAICLAVIAAHEGK